MLVREHMTKSVELGNPGMSLHEAARKMRDGDFGILPVGEGDRLVGMITDRDIAIRAVADGMDPEDTRVGDIMTRNVLYCYEDQPIEEVTRNLGENQVRRLPVLSREKRLVGILSLGDVARSHPAASDTGEALSRISEPTLKSA